MSKVNAIAPMNDTAKPAQSRAKRFARGVIRWFRTVLLLLVLSVAVVLFFLNRVGLPDFFKERVVAAARSKGLEVQFSRLRVRWSCGLVAENLHVQGVNEVLAPQLFVEEAECPLDPWALRNFQFKVNSLRLREGR